MLDFLAFSVYPYIVITLEIVVSFYRYYSNSYKFSSLSSEFLESNQLFWGSVSWHYGIIMVLLGHLVGFMFPKEVLVFTSVPLRSLIIEITALIFGLSALFGLILLIRRRITNKRINAVTSPMDMIVLILLLVQVLSGVAMAITYRWGINWYAASMVPYLKSVFMLRPDLSYVSSLPWLVKLHIISAYTIIAVLPFTRLVHFLVLPISYIWRRWQRVIWNYDRKNIRKY